MLSQPVNQLGPDHPDEHWFGRVAIGWKILEKYCDEGDQEEAVGVARVGEEIDNIFGSADLGKHCRTHFRHLLEPFHGGNPEF